MPAVRKIKSRQPKPRSSYRRKGDPWTQAELKRLGKTVDSALARRRRRTIKETVAEREARRLALPTGPRRWTAREIRMLGRFSDPELGRRLRRNPSGQRDRPAHRLVVARRGKQATQDGRMRQLPGLGTAGDI